LLLSAVPLCRYGSEGGRACCRRAVQQSIDIARLPGPQQQTRRTLLQRRMGEFTSLVTSKGTPIFTKLIFYLEFDKSWALFSSATSLAGY